MQDIKQFVESVLGVIRSIIEDKSDPVPVAFFFKSSDTADVEIVGIASQWMQNNETKDRLTTILNEHMRQINAFACCLLVDAWYLDEGVEEYMKNPTGISKQPGRKECLTATVWGDRLTTQDCTQPYTRNSDGTITWGEIAWSRVSSRFAGEDTTKPPEERPTQ